MGYVFPTAIKTKEEYQIMASVSFVHLWSPIVNVALIQVGAYNVNQVHIYLQANVSSSVLLNTIPKLRPNYAKIVQVFAGSVLHFSAPTAINHTTFTRVNAMMLVLILHTLFSLQTNAKIARKIV